MVDKAYGPLRAGFIRLVKVVQETDGTPGSFPNTTTPCVYKCMPCTVNAGTAEGQSVNVQVTSDPDKAIYVSNFRNNSPTLNGYYLVFRLPNGTYVFDNQAAFLENQ